MHDLGGDQKGTGMSTVAKRHSLAILSARPKAVKDKVLC